MLLDRILCCVAYKRIECRVEAKWGKTFSNCIYSDQHFFPKEDYLCEFSWIYSYIWLWLVKWKSALRSLVKWGGFYSFFLVFHLKCRWNVLHKGLLFNSVPANNKSAKDATCGRNTHNFLFISLHSPVLSLLFFFFLSALQFFKEYPALKVMNSRKIRYGTLCQHKQFIWRFYMKTSNTDAVMLEARYFVLVSFIWLVGVFILD